MVHCSGSGIVRETDLYSNAQIGRHGAGKRVSHINPHVHIRVKLDRVRGNRRKTEIQGIDKHEVQGRSPLLRISSAGSLCCEARGEEELQ